MLLTDELTQGETICLPTLLGGRYNKKKSFFLNEYAIYEGGSICNENPFITSSTNALGPYAKHQTKDQSVAVKMMHETLFYLSKFNKLHTF